MGSFTFYENKTGEVFEITDQRNLLENILFELVPQGNLIEEVLITSERPVFKREFDKTIVSVDNILFQTATSILDVLKRAPGVQVDSDGGIKLKNNIRPVVLIDGKAVPMSDEELNNYLKTLSPDHVESLEIIDNPSAKYDSEYKGK